MLNQFGGLAEIMIYPACTNLIQRVEVPATHIQGPKDAGWQATQLTCTPTQDAQDNLEHIQLKK